MRLLKYYITEAISTGKHNKRYTEGNFPKDYTDEDGIIRWLEDNGFERVNLIDSVHTTNNEADSALVSHKKSTGSDCYMLGKRNDTYRHWIRIVKDDMLYFIRTNDINHSNVYKYYMMKIDGPKIKTDYETRIETDYDTIVKNIS